MLDRVWGLGSWVLGFGLRGQGSGIIVLPQKKEMENIMEAVTIYIYNIGS